MRFFAVLKQYKFLFLAFFLAILILALMTMLVYLNSQGNFPNKPKQNTPTITVSYAGYADLQQQIASAATDPNINSSFYFSQFKDSLITLQTGANKQVKYNSLVKAHTQLISLYTFTSSPKVRTLLDTLNQFTKSNFPKEYYFGQFTYSCEDPVCSDDPPTKKFLDITSEIKNSDFPATAKNNIAQSLLAISYFNKNDSLKKARIFLMTASAVQTYSSLTKTGANVKISNDLYTYTKTHYLKEFNLL